MSKVYGLYESLIDDLIYLRKETGFKPSRLRNATMLLKLLGGNSQDFTDLKVRFTSAINSLPDKYAAETLLAAYALSDIYEDIAQLSARRKVYGLTIGLKPDAIAKHENAAIRELAIQLLTARYTMSPLPFSSNVVPHNAALHEYVEINTVVKNRLWQETSELYKIISLVNDVGWLEISSDIPAIVISTCESRAKTEPSSNGLRHRFHFDKPLMRGQATALSFTMRPDKELADPDTLILIEETRAFHEPTLRAKFTVQFIGQQPGIIWQYDHLAIYERPGEPRKRQLLTVANTTTELGHSSATKDAMTAGYEDDADGGRSDAGGGNAHSGGSISDGYSGMNPKNSADRSSKVGAASGRNDVMPAKARGNDSASLVTANFTDLYGGMYSGVAWGW